MVFNNIYITVSNKMYSSRLYIITANITIHLDRDNGISWYTPIMQLGFDSL